MSWNGVAPAPRRRRGHRGLALGCAGAAVLVVAVLVGLAFYGRGQLEAPSATHGKPVVVTVRAGESLDDIVADLDGHGLIRSRTWFTWFARFKGLGDVTPGSYSLDDGMGASAIIARLQATPDVRTVTVTLTEGMTAQQMAAVVAQSGAGITADQYMNEVRHGSFDEPFLAGRPAGASLEGFLFPDTYTVVQGASAHTLVQMQLDAFRTKAAPLLPATGPDGMSAYQTLTLASIVEREARQEADGPKVAGVLVNRLKQGMKLQVDATVAYGLGKPGAEPSADELQKDTPYNTYVHTGLPPTPISNPGVKAIRAAAAPASVPYIFYVSDGCGINHYATTEAEFEQIESQYVGKPCASATAGG